jgi:hypothetical protein
MEPTDLTTTESNSEHAVFIYRYRKIRGDTDSFLPQADLAAERALRLALEHRRKSESVTTPADLLPRHQF